MVGWQFGGTVVSCLSGLVLSLLARRAGIGRWAGWWWRVGWLVGRLVGWLVGLTLSRVLGFGGQGRGGVRSSNGKAEHLPMEDEG